MEAQPVASKALSAHAPLGSTKAGSWTPPPPPRVDEAPRSITGTGAGNLIRGGAAADSGLDAILERERRVHIGLLVAERYRIVRRIGAGGVGTVYVALDTRTDQHVAVKVLHWGLSYLPEMVAHFEREALAASRIEHPNVASASAFGRLPDGACFLVLELVEGQSLAEILTREGTLPPRRALRIARQVAAGLGAAHHAGIIHRDLKPDNIMLVRLGADADHVKVVDFGIAHVPRDDGVPIPQRGKVFGTPEYMAPEQAAGTMVDHRADIYTLGVVLYQMLSGRTPFGGEDMQTVLQQQMISEPPPLPRTLEPKTAALVMELIAKDPGLRPPSAEEVRRRIERLLEPGASAGIASRVDRGLVAPADLSIASAQGSSSDDSEGPPASVRNAPPVAKGFGGRLDASTWAVVAGAATVVVVASSAVVLATERTASLEARGPNEVGHDDLLELSDRATNGDLAALDQLEKHPPIAAIHWTAIGRGRASNGDFAASVHAYGRALRWDPDLRKDEVLLGDLRRAADADEARGLVLELAKYQLGEHGPDLVYDLWASAHRDPRDADLAREVSAVLHDPWVHDRKSPALAIALDLWEGESCSEYQALLPRAIDLADRRSVPVLRMLENEEGCGNAQTEDCFPCLRNTTQLREALESAEKRKPPHF